MTQKIHMVPVPEHLLPEVYAVLARGTSESSKKDGEAFGTEEAVLVSGLSWTPSDLGRLAAKLDNTAGRAMVTLIARNSLAAKQTSYEELRAAGEKAVNGPFTENQVRAQLSWVAKYCKALKGSNDWPFVLETRAGNPKGERYWYSMPRQLAEAWLQHV